MDMEYSIPLPNGPITLRSFGVEDVMRTYGWVTNPWYTGDFAGSAAPTHESHRKYFEGVLNDQKQIFLAVCADGCHVGNAGLKYFDSDACECWYYIGDEAQRGKGHAKRIVRLLCEVAFSINGVERVNARVLASNIKSSKALLANGFVEEGSFSDEEGREFCMYAKRRCGELR